MTILYPDVFPCFNIGKPSSLFSCSLLSGSLQMNERTVMAGNPPMPKDAKPAGGLFRCWRRSQTPDAAGTPSDAMPDAEPSKQDLSPSPPHTIFIGNSRADSLFAKRLVAELQQAQFTVWLGCHDTVMA
jgi:hypothetical protein